MNLKQVDLRKVYRTWKRGLGAYRCYFRSTPFVSLQTYDDFEIIDTYKEKEVDKDLLDTVLNEDIQENFILIDLELNRILDLALKLNNENVIKPILNINLLFNSFGLIGKKDHISKLISYSERLKDIKTKNFVMLVPYDRYNEKIDVTQVYDKLNNQYAIGLDDLPTTNFLKELGYKGISIITKEEVKEDLMEYIQYISKEFKVNLVRVDN